MHETAIREAIALLDSPGKPNRFFVSIVIKPEQNRVVMGTPETVAIFSRSEETNPGASGLSEPFEIARKIRLPKGRR
jgi:hypothetical protein